MSAVNTNGREINLQTLRKLLVMSVVMFGFGFALVPLYEKICQVTGIRNLLAPDVINDRVPVVDLSRKVSIEFDANTRRVDWNFKPIEGRREVHPGELHQALYEIRNTSDRPITGQAVPSYGPSNAARYFKKIDCFCFTQQTLAPGEVRRMPVVFIIDPELPKDLTTITLSYTFFEVAGTSKKPG